MAAPRRDDGAMARLSARQRAFVAHYLVDGDATAAAIRAGYAPQRAAARGRLLLRQSSVRQAIEAAGPGASRRQQPTRDQVVAELARIAFADIRNFLTWDDEGVRLRPMDSLSAEATACVSEIVETGGKTGKGLRVKLHGKLTALAALARLLGGEDTRETTGPRPVLVLTSVPEPDPPPPELAETTNRVPDREPLPAADTRPS